MSITIWYMGNYNSKTIKKLFIILALLISILSLTFISYSVYLIKYKYKNVKVIGLRNGYANQLYQFAFGYALQQKMDGIKVKYDVRKINTKGKVVSNKFWESYFFDRLNVKVDIWDVNIFEKFIISKFAKVKKCNELIYDYDDRCFDKNIGIYINRFFENPLYFKDYKNDINRIITTLSSEYKDELNDENIQIIKEMQSHKNSVVVNIRLGDFLQYKMHNICNFDYYKKAMKVFEKMEDVHFYISSNDIELVKNNMKLDIPHTFLKSTNKPYIDLILSSSAKHNIVSNSTFAIWAAMLNKNPDKIVVCPNLFLRQDGTIPERLLKESTGIYPDDWIKINVDGDKPIDKNNINTKLNDYLEK